MEHTPEIPRCPTCKAALVRLAEAGYHLLCPRCDVKDETKGTAPEKPTVAKGYDIEGYELLQKAGA